MSKEKKRLFRVVLILVVLICLNSCAPVNYDVCYVYPIAGEKVAFELEKLNYEQAPHFWEWLGRLDKLRQELEVCR